MLAIALTSAEASEFHGLNAGAPVWNGNVVLTPQKAQQFAATGTQSIRLNFRLDAGTTSWNAAQLSLYDQVIANARGAGLQILGLFSNETVPGGQAAWNDDPNGNGLNNYVSQFAATAQLLVSRYGSDIQRWEIWNEPNAWTNPNYASDPKHAGGTYILPRVYGRLVSETYRTLHSSNLVGAQGAKLMSGGLLAHDIGGSFSTAMDYMQQVYNQQNIWNAMESDFGKRYPWDEFGYHFYLSQGSALATSQLADYFNAVRSGQSSNNDRSNIAVTEFGWQTAGANTHELQRANMAAAYDYLENHSFITSTYWYQWTDDVTGAWGLVDSAGQPKLSYHEFSARNAATDPGLSPIVMTTQHAANDAGLSIAYSSADLLHGRLPDVLPGDIGWHPVNPASTNPNDPNGLAAFTDGLGDLGSGVTGLLNDYPAAGSPAKLICYQLDAPHDVSEIRIFTGNNGNDGRIFSTTAVWTSRDGIAFSLLGYFQSDPSHTQNNAATPGGSQGATFVRVMREDGSALHEEVTHIRFDFYAVSDLEGIMRDPYSGMNAYTGTDDGLAAAYVSPLVREIDVFGAPSTPLLPGDFNGDGIVDAADYVAWRANDGSLEGYSTWRRSIGMRSPATAAGMQAAVPEPASGMLLALASAVAQYFCRSRRAQRRRR